MNAWKAICIAVAAIGLASLGAGVYLYPILALATVVGAVIGILTLIAPARSIAVALWAIVYLLGTGVL